MNELQAYYGDLVAKYASEYIVKEAGLASIVARVGRGGMNRLAGLAGRGSKALAGLQKGALSKNMRWFGPNNQGKVLRAAAGVDRAAANAGNAIMGGARAMGGALRSPAAKRALLAGGAVGAGWLAGKYGDRAVDAAANGMRDVYNDYVQPAAQSIGRFGQNMYNGAANMLNTGYETATDAIANGMIRAQRAGAGLMSNPNNPMPAQY